MSHDLNLYLDDILKACEKVLRFSSNLTFESFVEDEKTFDAIIRNLEAIGEAAKHLPDIFCQNFPEIEWKKIRNFRDIIAHECFGIDERIVWDIVQNKIPLLLKHLSEGKQAI